MPRSRSPPPRSRNRDRSRSPHASGSSRPIERQRDDYGRSAYAPRPRDERPRRASPPTAAARRGASPDFARDRERERAAYDARAGISNGADAPPAEAEAPNFERSGLLAAASNQVNGVALKYHEPPEARKPKKKWRLYVYKDGKEVDLLHISRQSCYLIGRDRAVADIPIEHPSCSKQHAALQFRLIVKRNEFGDETKTIKLFLIDLDSANGCSINDADIEPSRYVELRTGDTIRFGASTREYVLLCED